MRKIKSSPTTNLDIRSIEARKEWMEHWRKVASKVSTRYLEPSMVGRSLKSWPGVAKSGLRPPKQASKRTGGTGQHS